MAKPVVGRASKDNSRKHPMQREDWMKGKKIGRTKQVWVWDTSTMTLGVLQQTGHWEKVSG